MNSVQFTAETTSNGVVEREFTVGKIPGMLWSPASASDTYAVSDRAPWC